MADKLPRHSKAGMQGWDGTDWVNLAVDPEGNLNLNVGDVTIDNADGAIKDGADGAIRATVKDYTNSNPLAVVLVDTAGTAYSAGSGGGGGAVTIADSADATQGAIGDAAVTGDNTGTISAKLRGLSKILADVWDSVNHRLKVDGSGVTQPISAASLPLPAGASAKVAMSVTAIQATSSGDTTLVSSGTRKLKRVEASNSTTTPVVVGLKIASLNSGSVFGKKYLPASGGLGVWVFPDNYLQVTSEAITINLSASGQVEVTAYYE